MSDANTTSLAYAKESSLGVLPSPQLKATRFTKESFGFTKETVESQEIRADRQVPDTAKVFAQSSGGFEFELSFGFVLPFIVAALQSEFQAATITTSTALNHTTQRATAAAGTFNAVPIGCIIVISNATTPENNGPKRVVDKATDGSYLVFRAGSLTATESSASRTMKYNTISNGVDRKSYSFEKRILNTEGADFYSVFKGQVCDSLELKLESKKIIMGSIAFVGTGYTLAATGADAGAVDNVKASNYFQLTTNATNGETVTVGTQVYTFRTSAATAYDVLIGATNSDSLLNLAYAINANPAQTSKYGNGTVANPLIVGSEGISSGPSTSFEARAIGALGNGIPVSETCANGNWNTTTFQGGITANGGYDAADDGSVMNSTNNVGTIMVDGATASDKFKSLTITLANNVRGKDAIGEEGNWDIGLGQFNVRGSMNAYFRDNTLPQKIKDHTTFSLDFYVQDAEGNRLYVYLPAIKPAAGDPKIEGINTDVMIETSFTAIKGTNAANKTGKMIWIDAVPVGG